MTTGPSDVVVDDYDGLRDRAREATAEGDLDGARELLDDAMLVAERSGEPELVDNAFCNLAAIDIALGEAEAPLARLRRILMANRSPENCFLAAYNIARAYEASKDSKKGLFYARVARDRAAALDRDDWLASTHNQIANFLVADSMFAEAAAEYRAANERLPARRDEHQLTIEVNLGYCEIMLGQLESGLTRLYASLRRARRSGLGRLEMIAHLDLCYGLLEVGRLRYAWRHGQRGLGMAESMGDSMWIKNGLYLCGEVALVAGDPERAHAGFRTLQERFYPGQPFIADFLLSVDIRPVINLRA